MHVGRLVVRVRQLLVDAGRLAIHVRRLLVDVGRLAIHVGRLLVDVGRLVVRVRRLLVDVGRLLVDVGRLAIHVGRLLVDVGQLVIHVGRLLVDVGHLVIHVGRLLVDVGRLVIHVGRLLVCVGRLLVHVGRLVVRVWRLLVHVGRLLVRVRRPLIHLPFRPAKGDHSPMLTVADTAYSIAVIRAEESERPAAERLFEDPYAPLFAAAGAHAGEGTARFLSLPFFRDGVRLRTRFIDDAVREGLHAGLDQVVLLGAGFDCRGMRLPEIAARGASVFEVDLAEQLDAKRALLAAAGVTVPPSLAYVPCDFAADFGEALTAAMVESGFRAGVGALFVWEGVIGYIDDVAIDRSLAFMVRAGGPGTRLVVTAGQSVLDRARRVGFTATEEHGCDALWRRYLPGEPHENAWVARLGTAVVGAWAEA